MQQFNITSEFNRTQDLHDNLVCIINFISLYREQESRQFISEPPKLNMQNAQPAVIIANNVHSFRDEPEELKRDAATLLFRNNLIGSESASLITTLLRKESGDLRCIDFLSRALNGGDRFL